MRNLALQRAFGSLHQGNGSLQYKIWLLQGEFASLLHHIRSLQNEPGSLQAGIGCLQHENDLLQAELSPLQRYNDTLQCCNDTFASENRTIALTSGFDTNGNGQFPH